MAASVHRYLYEVLCILKKHAHDYSVPKSISDKAEQESRNYPAGASPEENRVNGRARAPASR
jgi:hypothetical protein